MVAEIEYRNDGINFKSAWHSVVLPVPEGADTTNKIPSFDILNLFANFLELAL